MDACGSFFWMGCSPDADSAVNLVSFASKVRFCLSGNLFHFDKVWYYGLHNILWDSAGQDTSVAGLLKKREAGG